MSNFITNSGVENLKQRISQLIKFSEELKFLVGFFYFSGIRELYEGLKDNNKAKINILVGLNIDDFNFKLMEIANEENLSNEEKIYQFFESVKKSLNTENFDDKKMYEQIRFFIDLIKKNKLIIRKTSSPNHSKLYIFKLKENQGVRKLFITGSSNLTKAGLTTQSEFNVEISGYGFDQAENYFDELWKSGVKITELDETKNKLIEIIEKDTLIKDITPFEAFCLILKTYLDSFEKKEIGESLIKIFEKNGYKPYKYQLDAVEQALAIIEKNNGVIIADVVGLGKTVIACAIAKQMKKRGIVICPPGIIGEKNMESGWKKYLEEFHLHDWEVFSRGDLETALKFIKKANDIELVIVDEAHWFRNQDTKNYEMLKNICRGKQVMLLTATPFNNRPADILALLSFFITPKKSNITLENNLLDQFKAFKGIFDRLSFIKKYAYSNDEAKRIKALNYYKSLFEENDIDFEKVAKRTNYLATQIRNVIESVIIRRNRLDLKEDPRYKNEIESLSKVEDPKEWFFELTKEQSNFYSEIIGNYFADPDASGRFKGAIYRPFEYEKGLKDLNENEAEEKLTQDDNRAFIQQRNLFDFMRRLLVKRFESSFGSFEQSIKNFKSITKKCQEFINKTGEYILDRSLLEKIYELDIDEIENYLIEYEKAITKGEYPKTHKRYKINNFKNKDAFLKDIQNDINLFDEILEKLSKLKLVEKDPKAECLLKHLDEEINKKPENNEPKRKIIIFSEYVDTVLYLKKILEKYYGNRLFVVANDLSSSKIDKLNKNFDASYEVQENDFDILLTTDKLSEGFNLNRAGIVINYDIPWNPVRVIQRLGRINRINKKVFDKLYIVNFFPTEKGAELVKSREIAANKMFLIHNTLGEDSKIFDVDEVPTAAKLYNRIQQNPDKIEKESFFTKAYKEFIRINKENPGLFEKLRNYPPRIKVAKSGKENELLVFFTKGRLYIIGAKTDGEKINPYYLTFEDAFDKIICQPKEKSLDWNTDKFWEVYEKIKNFKDFRVSPVNEQSLEQKALNNLNFLIRSPKSELMPLKNFLRALKEDILFYATLPDYTLRRIKNFKENSIKEISDLRDKLGGENYLEKEKNKIKTYKKELIIAVENKKI